MKNVYICEKCGFQSDDYEKVRRCEDSHVDLQRDSITGWNWPALSERQAYKPGQRFPDTVLIPITVWDYDKGEYRETVISYKLGKELPESECAALYKAENERRAEEEARWRAEREEREAKKKAAEAAEQGA